jgi:hypothetical protein
VAGVAELHETVAVPEFATLDGLIAPHVRPEGTVSARETVPMNPLSAVTVIVEVAETPTVTGPGEVALRLKSVTVKVAPARWERAPSVPVIVRV